ncbi:MAG: hypothetical protein ABW054_01765 [Casimicrobiaceae bacterium]
MNNEATLRCETSLARQLKQLDAVGMSNVDRERAKAYLRRAEAVVDVTARAWNHLRGYTRRLRGDAAAAKARGAAAIR